MISSTSMADDGLAMFDQVRKTGLAILQAGFEGPNATKRIDDAKRLLDNAPRDVARDGRVQFAYALVLIKNQKKIDAITVLEQARGRGRFGYIPAHQALIVNTQHTAITRDQRATYLVDLAAVLGEENSFLAGGDTREQAAAWLGEAVGAVLAVSKSESDTTFWTTKDATIASHLKGKLLEAYQNRRREISVDRARLAAMTKNLAEETRRKQEEEREKAKASITANQKEIDAKGGQLKADFAKLTAEYNKRMALLLETYERDAAQHGPLQLRESSLTTEISTLSLNISTLREQLLTLKPTDRQGDLLRAQLARASQRMQSIRAERDAVKQLRQELEQSMNATLATAQGTTAEYQQATGTIGESARLLDQFTRKNAAILKSVDKKVTGKSSAVSASNAQLNSLTTFLKFDVDATSKQLIAELNALKVSR